MKKDKTPVLSEEAQRLLEDTNVLTQCKTEFDLAKNTMVPKWTSWYTYLKLYNNLKRDKEAVGNNLLYTLFNTILAYLYFDKLQVSFNPRESGDVDKCELISHTAKFDYEAMKMSKLQYDWLWDALFFGTGFMYIGGMIKQVPQVEVIDPFTIYVDPSATSIQDARFIALERKMTKWEMEKKKFDHIESLGRSENETQTKSAEKARQDAKNEATTEEVVGYENKEYIVLEWFTIHAGKKVHFFTDFNCSILLTPVKKLVFKDDEFPFVVKNFSPIPHEFWALSIPDLVEDKQRASAVLVNLSLAMEKSKLYPQYLYDRNAIQNVNDLKTFQFNKFIPTDPGNRSVADIVHPLQQQSMSNSTDIVYNMIRDFAERTLGTPPLKQGIVSSGKRTATELQLTQLSSDTRSSLSAKLFTLSEIAFWQKWFNRYKQFNALIKDKIIRIQGALGVRFVSLESDTFKFKTDPDISIESANVSAQQRLLDKQSLVELSKVLIDEESTTASKRFYKKRLLQLSDFPKDEIDQILPPTFDELRAQEENKLLEKGKMPEIEVWDDHYTHIITHNTVPQNEENRATIIGHIQAHKQAFLEQRQKEKEREYQQQTKSSTGQPARQPVNPMMGMAGTSVQPNINGAIEGFISQGRQPFERPQTPMGQNPMNTNPLTP